MDSVGRDVESGEKIDCDPRMQIMADLSNEKFSLQPITWEIFQLTLDSEDPLACLASTSKRQKPHSEVVTDVLHPCQLYIYRIFLRVTICKLNLRVTINSTLLNSLPMHKLYVPGVPSEFSSARERGYVCVCR